MRPLLLSAAALALAGCDVSSDFLQRMETQPRYSYYEESEFFADGRAMRMPPDHTVSRQRPVGNPALTTGRMNGQFVVDMPIELSQPVLARGQKRYNIVCAQCHGVLGDGNSIVAENMALRLPPSLVDLQAKPNGHFFAAITEGYGVMPSFSGEIDIQDRWAIVAYVRALQAARTGGSAATSPAGGVQPPPQENR
jgi:mono/diheme cytochrome c family protein